MSWYGIVRICSVSANEWWADLGDGQPRVCHTVNWAEQCQPCCKDSPCTCTNFEIRIFGNSLLSPQADFQNSVLWPSIGPYVLSQDPRSETFPLSTPDTGGMRPSRNGDNEKLRLTFSSKASKVHNKLSKLGTKWLPLYCYMCHITTIETLVCHNFFFGNIQKNTSAESIPPDFFCNRWNSEWGIFSTQKRRRFPLVVIFIFAQRMVTYALSKAGKGAKEIWRISEPRIGK